MLLQPPKAYHDRWWAGDGAVKLYARDYPAKAGLARLPVICLHGLTRNSADFAELATFIATQGRRVIVPDMRGRGLSDNDPDPMNYHPWTYAKDLLALCDALGVGRAIIIGTSMGGLIAMALSTLRSGLITSAILNDVGPVLSPKGLARITKHAAHPAPVFRDWHQAALYFAAHNHAAFPDYTHRDWLRLARRTCVRTGPFDIRPDCDPRISDAFRGLNPALHAYDMVPSYMSLANNRRILLIRGALSDVLDSDSAIKMASLSPHFTRVDIPKVGHAPSLSEPAARLAITDFLEKQG